METRLTATASFGAATNRHNGEEAHLHGHTFTVLVTVVTGLAMDWALPGAVRQLCNELNGRQLEDMMPGASTDLDGIAKWFTERLLMAHPGVVEVSVVEEGGDITATAKRELRVAVR